jgi:mRNA interferase RelE/StbE
MEIVIKKSFKRDLARLPANIQNACQAVLRRLKGADSLETAGVDYAPVRGQKAGRSYYRIRIGQYRMGIEYLAPDLIVITIAVRGDIYKTFPPK